MERKKHIANSAFLRQPGKFEGKFTATWLRTWERTWHGASGPRAQGASVAQVPATYFFLPSGLILPPRI
jgi:hypothetical protein